MCPKTLKFDPQFWTQIYRFFRTPRKLQISWNFDFSWTPRKLQTWPRRGPRHENCPPRTTPVLRTTPTFWTRFHPPKTRPRGVRNAHKSPPGGSPSRLLQTRRFFTRTRAVLSLWGLLKNIGGEEEITDFGTRQFGTFVSRIDFMCEVDNDVTFSKNYVFGLGGRNRKNR